MVRAGKKDFWFWRLLLAIQCFFSPFWVSADQATDVPTENGTTDFCELFSFTSCQDCLANALAGCHWCPLDGICTSSKGDKSWSCLANDYLDNLSCGNEPGNFFRYVYVRA